MEEKPTITTAKVSLVEENGKHQLLVNGNPFYIKGAGLEFGNIPSLAKHNSNSFRTWRTENGKQSALEVLNEAQANGLMVTMGIEVGRERHGFDYNDPIAVKEQLERIKSEVIAIKDHPALLIWCIGNELNLHYKNPKVWDAVNDIASMIKSVDPNHPTTTSLAGIAQREVQLIKERAPEIDILSLQIYGPLPTVPKLIKEYNWEGPYMVTEWGATGHWEVPTTSWGAPVEENSTIKANNYLMRYNQGIAIDTTQCIGSYVFLWGNKQERTPTWYGIFLEDGLETESVDVMHYIWNEKWPENRTPQIQKHTLETKTAYESIILSAGANVSSSLEINDLENDAITYTWEILKESETTKEGGDYEERPAKINLQITAQEKGNINFITPEPGNYRLFVYANDGHGHAATSNIPFRVE
ncbi:MAG: glycoside hydrolase family 2 TIM barrel-domain containing protein [Flavicella sp.]